MICEQCCMTYEASRATSRFCSDRCRQRSKRHVKECHAKPVTVTCHAKGGGPVVSDAEFARLMAMGDKPAIFEATGGRNYRTVPNVRVSKPGDADYVGVVCV